jgi:uncharacterized protein (DUF433 family)
MIELSRTNQGARMTHMASEPVTTETEYAHIVRTADMLGGEPRLAGTRIRVRDIAAARDIGGLAPEEIAAIVYPDLTLAQIYAALAYYEDHRAEINGATESEAQRVEEFLRDHPDLVHDVRAETHPG